MSMKIIKLLLFRNSIEIFKLVLGILLISRKINRFISVVVVGFLDGKKALFSIRACKINFLIEMI